MAEIKVEATIVSSKIITRVVGKLRHNGSSWMDHVNSVNWIALYVDGEEEPNLVNTRYIQTIIPVH